MSIEYGIIGVDVGKSKIAAGYFSADLVLQDYTVCPSGKCMQDILDQTVSIIDVLLKRNGGHIQSIGLAVFGIVDVKKGMVTTSGTLPDWHSVPVRDYVEERFRVPVYVENDVKSAAAGEYFAVERGDRYQKSVYGEHDSLLFLSIGTSVGLAYAEKGSVWHGAHGRFGEIAHYKPAGSQYSLTQRIGGKGMSDRYFEETNIRLDAQDLFLLAEKDMISADICSDMVRTTSGLLTWLDKIFDPGRMVLGGGVICHNPSLFQRIHEQYYNNAGQGVSTLSMAELKEKSGIYGAAALAVQALTLTGARPYIALKGI